MKQQVVVEKPLWNEPNIRPVKSGGNDRVERFLHINMADKRLTAGTRDRVASRHMLGQSLCNLPDMLTLSRWCGAITAALGTPRTPCLLNSATVKYWWTHTDFSTRRRCHLVLAACVMAFLFGAICLGFVFLVLSLAGVVDSPWQRSLVTVTPAAGYQPTLFKSRCHLITSVWSFLW